MSVAYLDDRLETGPGLKGKFTYPEELGYMCCIYSDKASFGKTYEMQQFAEKYIAYIITDSNNLPGETRFHKVYIFYMALQTCQNKCDKTLVSRLQERKIKTNSHIII